jgi:hypothetical protein
MRRIRITQDQQRGTRTSSRTPIFAPPPIISLGLRLRFATRPRGDRCDRFFPAEDVSPSPSPRGSNFGQSSVAVDSGRVNPIVILHTCINFVRQDERRRDPHPSQAIPRDAGRHARRRCVNDSTANNRTSPPYAPFDVFHL